MSEYINRDELLKMLPDDLPYKASVKRVLMQAQTADVVPKSEYDSLKKLFNDMTQEAKGYLNRLYGIRAEVAREIFEELERTVMYPNWASQNYKNWYFAELKEKYTEEKK